MDKASQHHSGSGDNVLGNKTVNNISIGIDVGRLVDILQENVQLIKELFGRIESVEGEAEVVVDETVAPISVKNIINDLTEFYEQYIKKHEGKLHALDNFFKEQGYAERIERAAENLRMEIFSRENRKSDKLNPHILNNLVQDHMKGLTNNEHKDIMMLIIFYLYRFCYIGCKNEA